MPVLDDESQRMLLIDAGFARIECGCGRIPARDYCRSCDEFYWIHAPGCKRGEKGKHDGHRLTIVPFVDCRLR
jgi:hypothetical protein